MITRPDDGPDFEPDDPLAVILRPSSDYLGPPAGRYAAIRRGAARRRLLRAAAGAGLTCAVAALVALPLRMAAPDTPVSPTVPLAPPPASSPPPRSTPPAEPGPSASPSSVTPRPGGRTRTRIPSAQTGRPTSGRAPSTTPRPTLSPPSAIPTPDPGQTVTTRGGTRP
ncbi:hypothetical protein OHB41_32505 [Streptomyces sp. NBC_01571]|uniref:hypothetical protein n=1 Tax=Streptomyces sp. NBC_01571 TaxID=2975883 RepID=UPI00225A6785|nr:hypothetical protein [Streptomyces sp. NBC_01571]MCX4577825.1 hypothetical protein [Streptomyces sp. NBC_01571]